VASLARWADAAVYVASLLAALAVARWESIPLLQQWGNAAVVPYALAAGAATTLALAWDRTSPRKRIRLRVAIAVVALGGALLLPLARAITDRAEDGRATDAQSEVILTEEAAAALVDGRDPYAATYDRGPLAGWPPGTRHHLPYLPGELVFGLPHAGGFPAPAGDARVWFLAGAALAVAGALAIARPRPERGLPVVLVLFAFGARSAVGGGDDLPVIGLMVLSLALLDRRRPVAAGLAIGAAAAMKQTAWPFLPFLILAARDEAGSPARRKALAAAAAPLAVVVAPFLLWHPGAFIEDVVLFPLGLAGEPTQAAAPTIGHLLSTVLPTALALLPLLVVLAYAGFVIARRPALTPARAAEAGALLLAAVVLLSPAGRFGYLLYPLNLLAWSRLVLRRENGVAILIAHPTVVTQPSSK